MGGDLILGSASVRTLALYVPPAHRGVVTSSSIIVDCAIHGLVLWTKCRTQEHNTESGNRLNQAWPKRVRWLRKVGLAWGSIGRGLGRRRGLRRRHCPVGVCVCVLFPAYRFLLAALLLAVSCMFGAREVLVGVIASPVRGCVVSCFQFPACCFIACCFLRVNRLNCI